MNQQHYKNHTQIVFSWHVLTGLALLALVAGSFRNLFTADEGSIYNASLIAPASLVLVSIYLHARRFALIAQDRTIRAEEGLRHYLLTGKGADPRLTLKQLIALRFASDEELPALAKRAADEGLTMEQIKKEIKVWRPDTYRV